MNHRLFVAINLPEEIKSKIKDVASEMESLFDHEAKFSLPENWHITVSFLGYQPETAIKIIIDSMKFVVLNYYHILKNMRIVLNEVRWGPNQSKPRMIWLIGDKNASLALERIKNNLEDELSKKSESIRARIKFNKENRAFNTHITLARFQNNYQENLGKIVLPKFSRCEFSPQSLDLMESHLGPDVVEYQLLERVDFRNGN